MDSRPIDNFIAQQGFEEGPRDYNVKLFKALNLQPKVTAGLVLVGMVLQSGVYFAALSALLWWCALSPRRNPFDAIHNAIFVPRGAPRLEPAPAPRRFSMGMAAALMLGISASLISGWTAAAVGLQALVVAAMSAVILGKLCLGSYIYHLLTGKTTLANRTLPWARS